MLTVSALRLILPQLQPALTASSPRLAHTQILEPFFRSIYSLIWAALAFFREEFLILNGIIDWAVLPQTAAILVIKYLLGIFSFHGIFRPLSILSKFLARLHFQTTPERLIWWLEVTFIGR